MDGDEVNPLLIVEVQGLAPTLGWTNVRLDPHVYITPPDDGVQDFDLVGDRPAPGPSGAADALTEVEGGWEGPGARSEEHTSELQSLMRISSAVFCLKKTIRTRHWLNPYL